MIMRMDPEDLCRDPSVILPVVYEEDLT